MSGKIIAFEDASKSVFDRRKSNHPWEGPLATMDASGLADRKALSHNWRMDHRVSKTREAEMLSAPDFASKADMEIWLGQIRRYWQNSFCRPVYPAAHYLECPVYLAESNKFNLFPSASLPGHEQLIHVASFNRLLRRVTNEGRGGDFPIRFREITGISLPRRSLGASWSDEQFNAHVDNLALALQDKEPDIIKELAALLIDGLGPRQPHWWACFAEEVAPFIASGSWAELCKALGLGHIDAGEWVLAWRYEVSQIGPFYRPTVVEAGETPFHFPSPPGYKYGITMPLAIGLPCCREIVHPPLNASLAGETCLGQLGKIVSSPMKEGYAQLLPLRNQQALKLREEFPAASAQAWLKRHSLMEAS